MENSTARFHKWFDLILTLIDGQEHTARELAEVVGTTTRNLYYVLAVLQQVGFQVVHEGRCYRIDPRSPFLQSIGQAVNFSEEEAAYLYSMLLADQSEHSMVGMLRRKLARFYGLQDWANGDQLERQFANVAKLEQAMAEHRVVMLHDYSSLHSNTLTNRVVEPFLFLGNKADIRAYEIKSHQNKTFKIARIGAVEIIDTPWFNEERHREVYTDMFMFSGEERHHVRLRFSLLAHHLMLEEYPHSASYMVREDESHWMFEADVVSYVGLSRFVLGLFDEVEVIEDEGFRLFLADKISKMPHFIGNNGNRLASHS